MYIQHIYKLILRILQRFQKVRFKSGVLRLDEICFCLVLDYTSELHAEGFKVHFVPEADLRYYSEEEAQKYLGLLGNNYDL
jgi:hypothetical protein